jgi:hypothetical protein
MKDREGRRYEVWRGKMKDREGGQSAQEVCPHECSGSLYHY